MNYYTVASLRKNDVKLVKKLIKKGADVNLVARGDRHFDFYENSAPPILYAANNCNVDIVKLLIDAGKTSIVRKKKNLKICIIYNVVYNFEGVDINKFQGIPQDINLQEPPDVRAIIYPTCLSRWQDFGFTRLSCGPHMLLKVLEHYLNAGVKLNTTSWGPCLFLGRGKVYEANQPTTLEICEPWFICTTAILLLQHGVDPKLYRFIDVSRQQE
ncbi:uncharacterized protein LOC134727389 [Mytilus trossulus]|uniref:uncharacterized protein LOC134727389 n=1 Tax=Mytilus trossulus TaxID=6551 RepID=UPI003007912E